MQILDHQHQRSLLTQPFQQPEHQLEQSGLGGLSRRVAAVRFAQGGQEAGQFWPGRADQPTDGAGAEVGDQGPHGLHDRSIRQGAAADGNAAAGQHPGPISGATLG